MKGKKSYPLVVITFFVAILFLFSSCNFQHNPITIELSVKDFIHPDAPLTVGIWPVYAMPVTGKVPLKFKKIDGPGIYSWVIWDKLQGEFAVAAFEDYNNNAIPDKNELLSYAYQTPITITSASSNILKNTFKLNISISEAPPVWSQAKNEILSRFFKYLNNHDLQIVTLFHPIRYFDMFYYNYDNITKIITSYFSSPTSETYQKHYMSQNPASSPYYFASQSMNGTFKPLSLIEQENYSQEEFIWVIDLSFPNSSGIHPKTENRYVKFNFFMDQNMPYITAMNFEAISRGIMVKASSQVVNKNDKITFTWSEDQYTSQNYPFHSYDVEFRVYSTPSSCVTELYSNPITPFTWSKPFEFYNSTGQIKVSTSNIVSPFNLYDKNTQQPLKFVAADGSKKDFKFNPYCLYMFKVWPHNNLAPSLSEQYRKEGPYGIVYIIGSKRWGGF